MRESERKIEHIAISRRPRKVLRQENSAQINLRTYTHTPRPPALKALPERNNAPFTEVQKKRLKASQLKSPLSIEKTASNNTGPNWSGPEFQLNTTLKNKLTAIVLSGLCFGSIVGYQWSTMLNGTQMTEKLSENREVMGDSALGQANFIGSPNTSSATAPTASLTPLERSINYERLHSKEAKELISQVAFLESKNSGLVNEMEALNEETTKQNRELLALELEVIALRYQSEISKKSRLVYNFVNTPIAATGPRDDQRQIANNAGNNNWLEKAVFEQSELSSADEIGEQYDYSIDEENGTIDESLFVYDDDGLLTYDNQVAERNTGAEREQSESSSADEAGEQYDYSIDEENGTIDESLFVYDDDGLLTYDSQAAERNIGTEHKQSESSSADEAGEQYDYSIDEENGTIDESLFVYDDDGLLTYDSQAAERSIANNPENRSSNEVAPDPLIRTEQSPFSNPFQPVPSE